MEAQTEKAPLGIIDSLGAGYSSVAQKPVLLLIPLVLDLFLWMGPRLTIAPVANELAAELGAVSGQTTDNSAALFQQNTLEILGSYNLFAALSTWPLGVPSLLAGNDVGRSPLGAPETISVDAPAELLLWLICLFIGGLLVGSLYLALVARWAAGNGQDLGEWGACLWRSWARILGLVLGILVGAFLLSVPFFLAVEIVALVLAPLAPLFTLVGIGLGMWFLFHLLFAPHGILLGGAGISEAVRDSVTLVRRNRLSVVGLLLIGVVISLGLTKIWSMPSSESWLRLVGIAGNAFVHTGLVAATFVYYQERIPN